VKNPIWKAFWYGMFTSMAMYMSFQDYLGLEGYVAYCKGHWMNLSPFVGAGLAALYFMMAHSLSKKVKNVHFLFNGDTEPKHITVLDDKGVVFPNQEG